MMANDGVRRDEAARSSNSPFTRRHANSIGRPTRPRSIFAQDWNLASSTSAPANAMSRVRLVPKAKLTLLDRTPMIFRLHALHAWNLSDDAVLIEHFQAKLNIREHDISRTPDDD